MPSATDALSRALIAKNEALVACQEQVNRVEDQLFSGQCLETNRAILIRQLVALGDEQDILRQERKHILDEMAHHTGGID